MTTSSVFFMGPATVNVDGAYSAGATTSQGLVNFNTATTLNNLSLSGGNLGGPADLTLTGTATWSDGNLLGTGKTIVDTGATLTVSSNDVLSRSIENRGTTDIGLAFLNVESGVTIENLPGATIIGDFGLLFGPVSGALPTINNQGLFDVQFSQDLVNIDFNNSGVVDLSQASSWSHLGDGVHSGTFQGGASSRMQLAGDHTFTASSSVLGGNVTLSEGTVNLAGAYSADSTFLSGGTLNLDTPTILNNYGQADGALGGVSDATLTGTAAWGNGTMLGTATTIVDAGATLEIRDNFFAGTGTPTLERRLINNGSTVWNSATGPSQFTVRNGGAFDNNGSFTVDVGSGATTIFGAGGGSGEFNNFGTFTKLGLGTARFDIPFNNFGLVDVQQGELELAGGGTGAGQFIVRAGADLTFTGGGFSYSGGITLEDGELVLGNYTIEAGVLEGTGSVSAVELINASQVSPGLEGADEIGLIALSGDYEQTADGALEIDVEGSGVGEFDEFTITGEADLGGELMVDATGLTAADAGETIEFLTATAGVKAGTTFDEVMTGSSTEVYVSPIYGASSVSLQVNLVGDMNGDGAIDSSDVGAFALGLSNPLGFFLQYFVSPDSAGGNLDDNGRLDFDDIDEFAALVDGVSSAMVVDAVAAALEAPTVPEPTALIAALLGAASFGLIQPDLRKTPRRER